MGQKLEKLFKHAEGEGGLKLTMRIAMKTGITSLKAASVPDTDDAIAKVRAAYKELTGKEAPNV